MRGSLTNPHELTLRVGVARDEAQRFVGEWKLEAEGYQCAEGVGEVVYARGEGGEEAVM